jgi:hypothetical protein
VTEGDLEGLYRFLGNDKVKLAAVLPHAEQGEKLRQAVGRATSQFGRDGQVSSIASDVNGAPA